MANCAYCGGLFEAKRSTAKFCSDKCKLAYHRDKVSVTNDTLNNITELSVSGNAKAPVVYPENWLRMTPNECSRWIRSNCPDLLESLLGTGKGIANFGGPDCECMHYRAVKSNGLKVRLNHGPYKTADQLAPDELNRVSLPGDADYKGLYNG